MPRRLFWPIALFLFVLACGTPRPVVTPTKEPPTTMPKPTATPKPTKVPRSTKVPVPAATPEPTQAPANYISHAELGDAWPLDVEDGTIICQGTSILLRTNRGLFAVNGAARGQNKWKDIRTITRPDPNNPGLIMNVQPIIDRGLIVCK